MPDAALPLRVFVDSHPLDVPPGATALDAVRVSNPAVAAEVEANVRQITDSRGLPIPHETPLVAGFIMRVIARRVRDDPGASDE